MPTVVVAGRDWVARFRMFAISPGNTCVSLTISRTYNTTVKV